jgi:lipoprotein-anchoring transpeptidase ErfK/SrfK
MGLNGVDAGGGRFGATDRTLNFTVGRDQETIVNLTADQATVYRDGKPYGSFAVTGGMPGLDTWGGVFAVIDKAPDVHMDSRTAGLGDEYDIPDVKWDVHITYSGTYIHAAPWSESDQGVRNVSHGCIGTSNDKAEWYFNSTLPGDIVSVINSKRIGAPGNGYNDWQTPWAQWLAGSAAPQVASE